ncbi:hypothetical protein IKF81_02605 [Candidatus Saccharibacteria bacterium]|nr:hypothetical protein [Candidatus Saccharibacteria bacterium]
MYLKSQIKEVISLAVIVLNSGKVIYTEQSIRKVIMELLEKFAAELNRPPSFSEVKQNPDLPNPNDYAFYFGSFDSAAKAAYLKTLKPDYPEGGEKMGESQARKWTKDEVLDTLERYYDSHGCIPEFRIIHNNPTYPSWPTIKRKLGDRETWLDQVLQHRIQKIENNLEIPETEEDASISKSAEFGFLDAATFTQSVDAETLAEVSEPKELEKQLATEEIELEEQPIVEEIFLGEENDKVQELVAEVVTPEEIAVKKAEAWETKDDGSTTIELKLKLPGKERPVSLTITF